MYTKTKDGSVFSVSEKILTKPFPLCRGYLVANMMRGILYLANGKDLQVGGLFRGTVLAVSRRRSNENDVQT